MIDSRRYVYRLHKALYGLKQGAQNWYDALKKAMQELGFRVLEADSGVFVKVVNGEIIIVAVHVDDCLVTGSSKPLIAEFKIKINKKYKITDLGECKWLLGFKISRDLANKTVSIFSLLDVKITNLTILYGDNQSAIVLAHGGQYHARTKHIDIRYHFIQYIIEPGSIKLIYCPTDEQTADTLTKGLPSAKAKHFASAMGLRTV